MKKILKKLIHSIILKKYPEITNINEIINLSDEYGLEYLENSYHVHLDTSECLDKEKMMKIDTEIKTIFKMLALENSNPFSIRKPTISTFFDCGDGDGYTFSAGYGYKH